MKIFYTMCLGIFACSLVAVDDLTAVATAFGQKRIEITQFIDLAREHQLSLGDEVGTLFIPSDRAFALLTSEERTALRDPENAVMVKRLLSFHTSRSQSHMSRPGMMGIGNGLVLDRIGNNALYLYRRPLKDGDMSVQPFLAKAIAGPLKIIDGVSVYLIDRVLVPHSLDGMLISSRPHDYRSVLAFTHRAAMVRSLTAALTDAINAKDAQQMMTLLSLSRTGAASLLRGGTTRPPLERLFEVDPQYVEFEDINTIAKMVRDDLKSWMKRERATHQPVTSIDDIPPTANS